MPLKIRSALAVAVVFTVAALLAAAMAWLALRNAGREVAFGGLLAAQLLSWHLWTLLTPAILMLGKRWRPRAGSWHWVAPHVCAAVAMAVVRTLAELLYLLPAEGLPITVGNLAFGLRGNLPFGILLDITVYAVILAFGTALSQPPQTTSDGARVAPTAEPLERIPVKADGRTVFVDVETIDWVEAADYYACLHAGGAQYLVRESLNRLEQRLAARQFLRVHRSAIVNLRRVAAVEPHGRGDAVATLADGTTVKVSRTNVASLRAAMSGSSPQSAEV